MQPWRPHGHFAPPTLTTMWPISPAASRPSQSLPSSTTPPPTPVPQNTPSIELYGWPAPSVASAIVATLTSLPSETAGPSSSWSAPASGNEPSQSGRLRALVTVPASSSTSPGEPTPIELSSDGSVSAAAAAPRTASAISAATSAGLPFVGVGRRSWPSTEKRSSTTTAWIFVPPRSTPARRFMPSFNRIGAIASLDVSAPTPLDRVREAVPRAARRSASGSATVADVVHRRQEDVRDVPRRPPRRRPARALVRGAGRHCRRRSSRASRSTTSSRPTSATAAGSACNSTAGSTGTRSPGRSRRPTSRSRRSDSPRRPSARAADLGRMADGRRPVGSVGVAGSREAVVYQRREVNCGWVGDGFGAAVSGRKSSGQVGTVSGGGAVSSVSCATRAAAKGGTIR